MAKQRLTQALDSLLKSALRLDRNLSVKDHRFWLWRSSFLSSSASPSAQAGFILPTVTLLLLMLSLVLGVLIFRTSNRTNQVIGERQQRQVYNAATPAIERAKAKLEVLFSENVRTITSDANIEAPLKNLSFTLGDEKAGDFEKGKEERVNLDGDDSTKDAAWAFKYDTKGDKTSDTDDVTVVYSILTRAPGTGGTTPGSTDEEKAKNLVVRNGPINLSGGAGNDACPDETRSPYAGWQSVGSGVQLRKAIQVHALAIPGENNPNKTVATIEMQQDKEGNLGNKWGAWFRNDMEIFPGPIFRWNGALNTSGSYFVRSDKKPTEFALSLYPISAPTSCVFTKTNSVMVMSQILAKDKAINGGQTYQGQLVVGSLRDNKVDANGSAGVRLFGFTEEYGSGLIRNTDSTTITADPINLALEPVVLLTEGLSRRRDGAVLADDSADFKRDPGWAGQAWVDEERVVNAYEKTPFADDTYRADNRWGPKPLYSEENGDEDLRVPTTVLVSDPEDNAIPKTDRFEDKLLRADPPVSNDVNADNDDEGSYGLDGYWERRSRAQGVRIVVGQRLELGNAYGWKTEVDKNSDGDTIDLDDGDVDLNGNGLLDFDPLYPPPANPGKIVAATPVDGSMAARQNELMQWKTLRNNPAAAQSTAVYHYLMDAGKYPVACLASAANPGTDASIEASTTFKPVTGKSVPNVSFLTGEGTNGWEFAPFGAATYDGGNSVAGKLTSAGLASARGTFVTAMNSDTSPMRVALSNLAYFSGDLAGAFPAFQDSAGENAANSNKFRTAAEKDADVGPKMHPYPILTMWGDYSNLRRVINQLDGGPGSGGAATYDELSLADQTTLQTASCTLGILAYNIENETASASLAAGAATETLYDALENLSDGSNNRTDGQIDTTSTPGQIKVWADGSPAAGSAPFYTGPAGLDKLPPEVIAQALPAALKTQLLELQKKEQVNRDRRMGFSQGAPYTLITNHNGTVFGMSPGTKGQAITSLQCDFEDGSSGLTRPSAAGGRRKKGTQSNSVSAEQRFLTLAYAICPRSAKYPSLYYLFPKDGHDHVGTGTKFEQPPTEPYTSASLKLNGADFDNRYAHNRGPLATAKGANINTSDGTARFRVVPPPNPDACGTDCYSLKAIALVPKTQPAWALPSKNGSSGSNVINNDGSEVSISLLDKGIFNGREHMGVRVIDLDIDLLRNGAKVTGSGKYESEDYWLPLPTLVNPAKNTPTVTGALLYAFREDATREDSVARPRKVSPASADWKTAWQKYSLGKVNREANYLMNASAFNTNAEQDPPANPVNGISPKPVDFFADPSRRPHGFRLRNGINLTRPGAETDSRGISLVSDNSVYVQGDFNVHSTNGTVASRIEEYKGTSKLADDWGNFYDRTDLNTDFARPQEDTWRTSEILSDAINVLSGEFKDGSTSEGVVPAADVSSYSSLNYPIQPAAAVSWLAADGRLFDENQPAAVKISQRGLPVYCALPSATTLAAGESCLGKGGTEREFGLQDAANQKFLTFKENKDTSRKLQSVPATNQNFVNSLVVSGMTPSRVGQANGGLHNFLRLNENWNEKPLWFAGSLFQLNFSHTATAAYDQEAWEPDTNTKPRTGFELGDEQDEYFSPPDRRWGYDVALQYVQPSPVAQRFNRLSNVRSEFYQELPIDDPYIKNLRCAKLGAKQIDPNAKGCT